MGVDYSPVLLVGKTFDDEYELEAFVMRHIELSEEDNEYIEDEGFSCFAQETTLFDCQCLNCYSGYGYVVGFDIGRPKPETFKEDVDKAISKWNALFKDEKYDIIHTVRIW